MVENTADQVLSSVEKQPLDHKIHNTKVLFRNFFDNANDIAGVCSMTCRQRINDEWQPE